MVDQTVADTPQFPPLGPWAEFAACHTCDPAVNFFPGKAEDPRPAKAVCAGCPVQAECLADALASPETLHGIWGGSSARQRRRIRRDMKAGLPVTLEHQPMPASAGRAQKARRNRQAELAARPEMRCSRCHETKPVEQMTDTALRGRTHWCLACRAVYDEFHRERRRLKALARRQQRRMAS